MKVVAPSAPPALIRALGADPVVVTIAGAVQPDNRYGTITLRRARGARDPIGSPATCSLDLGVDTPPTWKKGDPISVKLSEAVLTALYGSANVVTTNLATNPSFELDAAGWFAAGAGTTTAVDGSLSDTPADVKALKVTTAAVAQSGVRTSEFACAAASTYGAAIRVRPGVAMTLSVTIQWLDAAATTQVGTTVATYAPADLTVSEWNNLTVQGVAPAGAAKWRVYVRREVVTTAGQVFHVDALLARQLPAGATIDPYDYFDGGTYADPVQDGITYAWTGTPHASTSTRTYSPATLKAQARYRFQGRISDLQLVTTRGTARASIIATGYLAALGATDVGDVPWPAESVQARVLRVFAAANAKDPAISYSVPGVATANVPAKDVDRQGAAQLLEALSESTGPRAGVWEKRDGTLTWVDGFTTAVFPSLAVDGHSCKQPLLHEQADRVNQVTVTPSGKPTVGQLLFINQCPNPSFEVNLNSWASSGGATLSRDTVTFQAPGVASLKAVATGTAPMGAAVVIPGGYPGQVLHISPLVRRQGTTGPVRVVVQWQDAAAVTLATSPAQDVTVTANVWTRLPTLHFGEAPAGTTQARVYIQLPTTVVGQILNVDRVAVWEDYQGVPPGSLDYFDGSTAATADYTFAWEGTASNSRSFARATASTPTPSFTWTDLASVAQYGVQADQVASLVDIGAAGFTWDQLITRAKDQVLAGGWKPPDLELDLLTLLDGRVDYVQAYDTPREAAKAALRSELGSQRSYSPTGDEAAFVPDMTLTDVLTALNETISAHRWTLHTSAERTF